MFTSTLRPFTWTEETGSALARTRYCSLPLWFCHTRTPHVNSRSRWMHLIQGSVRSYCSVMPWTRSCTPVPSSVFSHTCGAEIQCGNRELLALVMALQEWRHWLGVVNGAVCGLDAPQKPGILAGHQASKWQADWALYYQFNFVLTYRPGTPNQTPYFTSSPLTRLHCGAGLLAMFTHLSGS